MQGNPHKTDNFVGRHPFTQLLGLGSGIPSGLKIGVDKVFTQFINGQGGDGGALLVRFMRRQPQVGQELPQVKGRFGLTNRIKID